MGRITIPRANVEYAFQSPQASSGFGARIPQTSYKVKCTGGGITLYYGQDDTVVGKLMGAVDNGTALVQEINTKAIYEQKGIGKLLAASFLAYAERVEHATSIKLGTNDVSMGFWPRIGVSQGAAVPIANVWNSLGAISVEHPLEEGEVKEKDRSKVSGLY